MARAWAFAALLGSASWAAAPNLSAEVSPNSLATGPRTNLEQTLLASGFGALPQAALFFIDTRHSERGLYFTRLDANGASADPDGVRVMALTNGERIWGAAFNGTNYLVAVATPTQAWRVSPSGVLLDQAPVALPFTTFSIASNGSDWLLGSANSAQGSISFSRISAAGVLLDATPHTVSGFMGPTDLSLGWDGTQYIAAWTAGLNQYAVLYSRVDTQGVAQDPAGITLEVSSSMKWRTAIACTSTAQCAIAWSPFSGSDRDVKVARIAGATKLDNTPLTVASSNNNEDIYGITWDGQDYLIAWMNDPYQPTTTIGLMHLTTTGTLLGGVAMAISGYGNSSGNGMASTGTSSIVLWQSAGAQGLYDNAYGQGAAATVAQLPLTGANAQTNPSIASDGQLALVAWPDARPDGGFSVFAALMGLGTMVSPAIELAAGKTPGIYEVAVASTGTDFFVLWARSTGSMNGTLEGTAVRRDGGVANPGGRLLYTTNRPISNVCAASMSGQLLATWVTLNGCSAQRLDPTGTALDGTVLNVGMTGTNYVRCGALSGEAATVEPDFDGGTYLAVRRVPVYPGALGARRTLGSAHNDIQPSMVSGGPASLVMISGGYSGLWATSFDAQTFAQLSDVPLTGFSRAAAGVASTSVEHVVTMVGANAVGLMRIAPNGAPFDNATVWRISENRADLLEGSVAVAAVGPGALVVAYARRDDTPPFHAPRVFLRRVSFNGTVFTPGTTAAPLDAGMGTGGGAGGGTGGGGGSGTAGGTGAAGGGAATAGGSGTAGGAGGESGTAGGDGGGSDRPLQLRASCGCGATHDGVLALLLIALRFARRAASSPSPSTAPASPRSAARRSSLPIRRTRSSACGR